MEQSVCKNRLISAALRLHSVRARALLVAFGVVGALCAVLLSQAQRDTKKISFYTAQTAYSLPIFDRNNSEYVGLFEALEPMGPVSAHPDGKKYKLKFRDVEAQFESGKTKAKVRGKSLDLAAPFLIENNRGFVPVASLKELLPLFGVAPEVHEAARRVFVGSPAVRVFARKMDMGKVSFIFSAPVNPFIATEAGKLRMIFDREPLQSDAKAIPFDDKVIPSAVYSESNGSAELTVNGSAPLTASFSDDRKTITISAVMPQTQAAPAMANGTGTGNATQTKAPTQAPAPAPKPRPFVIIDAAHGGADRGVTLGDRLAEKDVTLGIAHRLRHELEARGIQAILVRDGDSTLTADQRANVANSSKAAFYVGLHASATGVGVHVYSAMVAPTAHTAMAFLPVRTAQASQVEQSRAAASTMAQAMAGRELRSTSLPASLAPLNSIALPAVAVEVGPSEPGNNDLGSASYEQSLAGALASAIAAVQAQLPREAQ